MRARGWGGGGTITTYAFSGMCEATFPKSHFSGNLLALRKGVVSPERSLLAGYVFTHDLDSS